MTSVFQASDNLYLKPRSLIRFPWAFFSRIILNEWKVWSRWVFLYSSISFHVLFDSLKNHECDITAIFYIVEYNVKICWGCVNYRVYLTKKSFKKSFTLRMIELEVQKSNSFHPAALYEIIQKKYLKYLILLAHITVFIIANYKAYCK